MSLRSRFLLVGLGILIFLIVTPILVLYARGFKYDFLAHKIVKTGALVVRTEPAGAKIFLDNQLQTKTTPANLRFLTPKDYDIRVEKDGYQSWSKRLPIHQQLVTWANDSRDYVTLFLKSPKPIEKINADAVYHASSKDALAYSQVQKLYILTSDNASSAPLGDFKGPQTDLANQLVWTDLAKPYQVLLQSRPPKIPGGLLQKIDKIKSSGDYTALTIGGELYRYNRESGLTLIGQKVLDFDLADSNLWYLENKSLRQLSLNDNSEQTITDQLPGFTAGTIVRTSDFVFLILDQTLYLVNKNLEKIYSPVTAAYSDSASNKLVLSNANEILLFDPSKYQTVLVIRSLSPLKNPVLNIQAGYMFFQNENKIKAVELDARDHQNSYTIADALDDFLLSKDATKLYVYNNQEIKIYKIR